MAKKTEKLVSKKNKPEVKKIEKKKAVALKETKDKEYRTEEKPISEKKKERSKTYSEKNQGEIIKEDSPIIHLASDFKIKVENVVAFATFGVDIPLEKLVKEVENTEYEP